MIFWSLVIGVGLRWAVAGATRPPAGSAPATALVEPKQTPSVRLNRDFYTFAELNLSPKAHLSAQHNPKPRAEPLLTGGCDRHRPRVALPRDPAQFEASARQRRPHSPREVRP